MSDHADSIDQLDTADRTHTTTEQQQSPGPDPAEAYDSEYRRLWNVTVDTLTAAVRLRHPQHGAADFGDFLVSVIAAVAANVGSAERVIAGTAALTAISALLTMDQPFPVRAGLILWDDNSSNIMLQPFPRERHRRASSGRPSW